MPQIPPERTVFTRKTILDRLRLSIAERRPIVAAGSSVGIVAKSAAAAGATLIIVYSTGRSRIRGLPTTPIGHSNHLTMEMFDEIENVVDDVPIIGGAEAADPTFRRVSKLVRAFRGTGFDGLINFPSMGEHLEQAASRAHVGQGYDEEVAMIRNARDQDFFTMAYAWNVDQAHAMAGAGVDVLVPHVGWTAGGLVGAAPSVVSLEEGCARTQAMIEAARSENRDVICLSHGGPFAAPEDTRILYEQTDAQGFVGASSIERIPIEEGVMAAVRAFRNFRLRGAGE